MVALATTTDNVNPVEAVVILVSLVLLCMVFAWDGLVRRRMLLPSSPLGGGSISITGVWALLVGSFAALFGGSMFFLLVVYAYSAVTQCHGSLTCIGETARTVDVAVWVWLGLTVVWIVLVWLRAGNPYKRVLVYGVWYHQDKVARLTQNDLAARGLKPLPKERIYALAAALIQTMHQQHWLVNGKVWLDGGTTTAKDLTVTEMLEVVLHQPAYQQSGKSQRAAIAFLLSYFKTEAQRAQRMWPFHRWLVGTAQIGKRQVYGRRAI